MVGLADLGRFILNQYNATKFNQRTAKSQLVAELGPVQPQLVLLLLTKSTPSLTCLTMKYLPSSVNSKKYVKVHINQTKEREDPCCECWVPYQGQGVPKYKGCAISGISGVYIDSSILLIGCYFHEFWNIEDKRQHCHGKYVDHQPLCIAHRLQRKKLQHS